MVLIQKTKVSTFMLYRPRSNEGGKKRGCSKGHCQRRLQKLSQFNQLSRHANLAQKKSLEIMQCSYQMQKGK